MSLFSIFSKNIGIDLGTTNTVIYVENEGIVLNEPSVVAVNKKTGEILSIGNEAREMLGRTPSNIIAVKPMRDGVIADFEIVEKMIRFFIQKVNKTPSLFKPKVAIGVPTGITEVERRAVNESCEQAGARDIFLIEEPLAAAIGANMPTSQPIGNMIVDIGGGTTEIAIISLGSIVLENSIRVGGNEIDSSIIEHIKNEHNIILGERTVENIKINFADVWYVNSKETYVTKGRDSITGLPRSQEITKIDLYNAIKSPIEKIVNGIKLILDRTPPELASDIIDQGIMLSGGGAMIKGLKEYLSKYTGVPVIIAEDPLFCVVKGVGTYLKELRNFKNKKKIL